MACQRICRCARVDRTEPADRVLLQAVRWQPSNCSTVREIRRSSSRDLVGGGESALVSGLSGSGIAGEPFDVTDYLDLFIRVELDQCAKRDQSE